MIAKRRNLYVLECKLQLPIFVLLYLSYSMDRVYIGVENSDGSISDIPLIASRCSDFALRAIAMLAQQQQQQQQSQQQQPQQQQAFEPEPEMDPEKVRQLASPCSQAWCDITAGKFCIEYANPFFPDVQTLHAGILA